MRSRFRLSPGVPAFFAVYTVVVTTGCAQLIDEAELQDMPSPSADVTSTFDESSSALMRDVAASDAAGAVEIVDSVAIGDDSTNASLSEEDVLVDETNGPIGDEGANGTDEVSEEGSSDGSSDTDDEATDEPAEAPPVTPPAEPSVCLLDWRDEAAADSCLNPTQSDWGKCADLLDCWQEQDCSASDACTTDANSGECHVNRTGASSEQAQSLAADVFAALCN